MISPSIKIGLDLDNTIVDYNNLFNFVARKQGLIPNNFIGGKVTIRDFLRSCPEGETNWRYLQGQVYGPHMGAAVAMSGALDFVKCAVKEDYHLYIVSHKTRSGHYDDTGTDLHKTALDWLNNNGFVGSPPTPISESDVYFCPTQYDKIKTIAKLKLDYFVDDLEEILSHKEFPQNTLGILFGDNSNSQHVCFNQWCDIKKHVLD
jgi:hypothetical protein